MCLLRDKLITEGEKREILTKTCNETMLRDKLRVFVSGISPPLCACQRLVNFWDGNVVISRLWILYRKPGFQEKSLVKISLMSNNSGTSKIHFVVVFVDMAEDLGVMVEHRNSPFVFRYPGF